MNYCRHLSRLRVFRRVVLFTLLIPLCSQLAIADKSKNYSVSQSTFKVLTKSRKLSLDSQYQTAINLLNQQLVKTKENRYETALIFQHLAYIYLEQQDYKKAQKALEKTLGASDTLPPKSAQDLLYNLAQVYMQTEQYNKTLPILEQWFEQEKNPKADAWYLKALVYYKLDKFSSAVEPLKKAIALSPHENWYVLLLSIYLEPLVSG